MILFELRCGDGHQFEAWFKDGATFDVQAAGKEIACPHCGDVDVAKAVMAPRLNSARGDALDARGAVRATLDVDDAARAARKVLGEIRRKVESDCENVGERFPEEARKIHYGETAPRGIYGEASRDEARELEDEGVAIARIPWVPLDD